MKISGLQKMTLLDYPQKVAATVFLGGCNFRCPYCHNASLVFDRVQTPEIPTDTFFTFLQSRRGLLDGVCVTGGEPLLQDGLEPFFTRIKELGFLLKLDTNGSYPKKLKALAASGLIDYVAMDIKNSPAKYAQTAGVTDAVLPAVRESVEYLLGGPVEYEFRTTVVRTLHTVEDMAEIGQWIRGAKKYFLQNFVDSDDIIQPGLQGLETPELEAFLACVQRDVPSAAIRNL